MTEEQESKEKKIRVVWGSDEELPALYANHLYVSHTGGTEFHIIFGHLSPPLTAGLDENELPESLKVKPVAKIVVSPEVMRAFVKLLHDNYEKFEGNDSGEQND